MSTHTLTKNNPLRIVPHSRNKSSRIAPAGTGTDFRAVLTIPSPKHVRSGYSLADMIEERGRLDDNRVISTCIAILEALFERMCDGGGIFPRNLTPSGIIFNENGGIEFAPDEPEITLVSRSTVSGVQATISGIPAYMSPEHATGINEGSRFGIYTFGAIMYAMLTGRAPYYGDSPRDTLEAVKRGPPVKLIQLNPAADHRLVAICERCMNRRINCRYLNLFDIYADLERLRSAIPPKSGSRVKGWVCSMLSAFI